VRHLIENGFNDTVFAKRQPVSDPEEAPNDHAFKKREARMELSPSPIA
jgi:hypothetical protein